MACTKCDITNYAIQSANKNNIEPTKAKLIARMVFESLQSNENKQKSKKKEFNIKNSRVLMNKIRDGITVSAAEALVEYEMAFKDVLRLKLTPIKVYEDIEKIREQLWRSEDKLHDAERAFMNVADGNEDERKSRLLNVRLDIRERNDNGKKEVTVQNETKVHKTDTSIRERKFDPSNCQDGTFRTINLGSGKKGVICKPKGEDKTSLQSVITPKKKKKKETIQKNENEDFLGDMQGKNKAQQLQILKQANPDIDIEILKNVIIL
jgi:hypothetical protein